jgi:glycerophosphoryl diester phosphodiesterase
LPVNIPHLIAHRGYAKAFPENTLLSLDAAVQAGARWVEFDVQLTADAVPVVLHDETFIRTAGYVGSIFETYAADLEHICVNETARFGPHFPQVRISSLETVVLWLKGLSEVTAFVEIKTESLHRFGFREAVVAVLHVLESVKAQCVLISFAPQAVLLAREISGIATGWVLPQWDSGILAKASELRPDYVFCDRNIIPPAWKNFAHYPWQWAIYEVTDAEEALKYAAWGVAFIETMAMGEMLQHPLFQSASESQLKATLPVGQAGTLGSQPL